MLNTSSFHLKQFKFQTGVSVLHVKCRIDKILSLRSNCILHIFLKRSVGVVEFVNLFSLFKIWCFLYLPIRVLGYLLRCATNHSFM